eukprot:2341232-Pyramimonas_sp.AAC.1
MSTVPWAVNAEIYQQELRGFGASAATSINWITNLVVSQTFLHLILMVGVAMTFWIYASIACFGLAIFYLILPETKGLSLEAIQEVFHAPMSRSQGPASSEMAGVVLKDMSRMHR